MDNSLEDMYQLSNILNTLSIEKNPIDINIDFLKSKFSESNQKIAKKFNLPLKNYNYVGF